MANEDKFVNIMTSSVLLSAANTLSFTEIPVGLNLFDKVGLLIQRLEYEVGSSTYAELTATGDNVEMGLVQSDLISDILLTDAQVIDKRKFLRMDFGAAASGSFRDLIVSVDFSTLKGGGLLIPPKPLYLAGNSNGLANPAFINIRVYFIIKRLQDAEYLELLETRRAFG